ncbi:hypothetical protein P170DRAFT_472249 [Aspergillus steynii IBT 23096]|uniref:Uncharacterized protein n=1 Tax=Aspergillus steynii IBT 23096 TaxID=1392250 RepID=A0A2I2GHJ9_9EURO|nr:uncharacterized protein P170DRAFT_472249 [Aspergillus steynii IBT 23096]PLB52349.1 hypothetical protein P170DRAFT_472249 [Aspergillus steynii IBT 23096]
MARFHFKASARVTDLWRFLPPTPPPTPLSAPVPLVEETVCPRNGLTVFDHLNRSKDEEEMRTSHCVGAEKEPANEAIEPETSIREEKNEEEPKPVQDRPHDEKPSQNTSQVSNEPAEAKDDENDGDNENDWDKIATESQLPSNTPVQIPMRRRFRAPEQRSLHTLSRPSPLDLAQDSQRGHSVQPASPAALTRNDRNLRALARFRRPYICDDVLEEYDIVNMYDCAEAQLEDAWYSVEYTDSDNEPNVFFAPV